MGDMPPPLALQFGKALARRMGDAHRRNILNDKAGGGGAAAPILVFGGVDAGERPDCGIDRAAHGEVAGARETALLDIEFLAVGEHRLIGFERRQSRRIDEIDADVTADDAVPGIGLDGIDRRLQPAGIGDAVGVDEGQHGGARGGDAGVARQAGAGPGFAEEGHAGIVGGDGVRKGRAVIIDDDDFERAVVETLPEHGIEAAAQGVGHLIMRDDHRDANVGDRRPGGRIRAIRQRSAGYQTDSRAIAADISSSDETPG